MRFTGSAAAAVALVVVGTAPPAAATGHPGLAARAAYSSIPAVLPGNTASIGFEATSTSEFGNEAGLGGGGGVLRSMRVVFTSGACQTRIGPDDTCVTKPGATFSHPITANIYAVGNSGPAPVPGALLASVTRTSAIPFRRSEDPVHCPGTHSWFSPKDQRCFAALAVTLRFGFPGAVRLPSPVIWTVAFNTTHSGYQPIGPQPCDALPAHCGYDSLNAGTQTFPGSPYAGTNIFPNGAFLNTGRASVYCDDGAAGVGFLRLDDSATTDCWRGFTPLAAIDVAAAGPFRPGRPRRVAQQQAGAGAQIARQRQHGSVDVRAAHRVWHRGPGIVR